LGESRYIDSGTSSSVRPLALKLDFRSSEPVTGQICEQIRLLILSGQLRPGDQLPTVRQLAADLRVNFNTVARAYRQLDEEGLISTQHGRGTFVIGPPAEAAAELRHEAFLVLTQRFVTQATQLGFDAQTILERVVEVLRRAENNTAASDEASRTTGDESQGGSS